jgi:hypothetical protein
LHITIYTIYNIQYKIYNIQYTIYNIQYKIYNIQYTIHNIQYTIHNIQYTIHNIQYTIWPVLLAHICVITGYMETVLSPVGVNNVLATNDTKKKKERKLVRLYVREC